MKWFQMKGPDTIAGVIQARTRQYERLALEAHMRIQTAEDKVLVAEELAKTVEEKANATESELVQANITIGTLQGEVSALKDRMEKLENPKEVRP